MIFLATPAVSRKICALKEFAIRLSLRFFGLIFGSNHHLAVNIAPAITLSSGSARDCIEMNSAHHLRSLGCDVGRRKRARLAGQGGPDGINDLAVLLTRILDSASRAAYGARA
jgi:hypothetical protein